MSRESWMEFPNKNPTLQLYKFLKSCHGPYRSSIMYNLDTFLSLFSSQNFVQENTDFYFLLYLMVTDII